MLSLIVLASTLLAQSGSLPEFAGTWIAQVKGQPLARLELTVTNGEVQGQLSLAGMHVDANGDVDNLIPDVDHTASIFDATFRDSVLSFATRDGDDTDHFEARLVDGRVTLTFVVDAALRAELAQEGIPAPRPIAMTRVSP